MTRRSRLVALRDKRGLSQEELAELVGVHLTTYKRWEDGTVAKLRPRHKRALADALDWPVDQMGWLLARDDLLPTGPVPVPMVASEWGQEQAAMLANGAAALEMQITPEVAPRLVHEWLVVEPPQDVELQAGRRIGISLVARMAHRVDQLRHLDDYVAGTDLQNAVRRELTATAAVVRDASYVDTVGRRLFAVLGDLCQLAGWAAADAGEQHWACHYYATGIAAAHAAGDQPLAGQLASTLAYHVANNGRPRDAVLLAQSAIAGSRDGATATTKALFLERLAWAHARSGDTHQTERSLGSVNDIYADRDPSNDPEWVYWLTPEEVDVMAGRCYVELRLPDRAQLLLSQALHGYGEDRPREAALYTSWLAEAHLQAGDVDQAAELAHRVLDLTALTASVRSDQRARHLHRLLRPHRRLNAVQAFDERYQTLVP